MRKRNALIIVLALSMMLVFTGCSDRTKMIGRWNVTKVTSGELEMNKAELEELGLSSAGYIMFKKSGNCVLSLLGDEYEGTWTYDEQTGEASIVYDEESRTGVATRADKVVTFIDSEGNEYTMEK